MRSEYICDFRPLIYVIPYEANETNFRKVAVNEGAAPIAPEYIASNLKTGDFDIIDIGDILK